MNIKRFLSLPLMALGFANVNAANEPVVMTIDGEPIYKSEFEYVYKKNNSTTTVEKKSVDEYVDLFINYKLKVLNAKEDGLDDSKAYIDEYRQYREQLAQPYFLSNGDISVLEREAYDRIRKKVACSHILVNYNSKDSVPPYIKISKIQRELKNGASFSDLAKEYSDCPSGKNGGYLGNVECFQMVYDFENVIFNLKPGEVSEPFKTKFGYHIATVLDVRPNVWKKRASQIFVPSSDPNAEQKADSLYNLVKNGANINKLAAELNVTNFNGTNEGRLPWLSEGSAEMPPEVVNAIMGLEKVGDIVKSKSRVGWHVFRLDSTNLDLSFEQCEPEIRQRILKSDRAAYAQELLIRNLYDRYGVNSDTTALADFYALARNSDDLDLKKEYATLDKPLYSFLDETYPQSDFIPFFDKERSLWNNVLDNKGSDQLRKAYGNFKSEKDFVNACFVKFLRGQVIEKSYEQLEKSNSEYRNLLKEYSDGLLLFNISNDKVWNLASRDQSGLEQYFAEHKSDYKWNDSHFRGWVFYCKNNSIKKKANKFYNKHKDMPKEELQDAMTKELNKKGSNILCRHGLFQKGKNKAVDYYIYKVGSAYEVEKKSYPEVLVVGTETYEPESFTEVRGAVVADYQNKLEADWIKTLRNNHKVVVDYDVLKTIK